MSMILQLCKFFTFEITVCVLVTCYIRIHCLHAFVQGISIALIAVSGSWLLSGLIAHAWKSVGKKRCSIDGKCVLITGCDTGFGHVTALHLNRIGFTVFAGCLFPDGEGASRLQQECTNPNKMHVIRFDVRSDADIMGVLDYIQSHMNEKGEKFHSLVNNAGIAGWSPLEWGTMDQDVDPVIAIDLTAVVKITKTFMPLLRQTADSRIVFLTSQASCFSIPFLTTYCVAKRGVKFFADVLRAEVDVDPAYYNMKIVNIQPTAYKTGITEYDSLLRNIDQTWSRTSPSIQQAHGRQIYDGFKNVILLSKFFRIFDFVGFQSDLLEVAKVIENVIRTENPPPDYDAVPLYAYYSYRQLPYYLPDECMDLLMSLIDPFIRFSSFLSFARRLAGKTFPFWRQQKIK